MHMPNLPSQSLWLACFYKGRQLLSICSLLGLSLLELAHAGFQSSCFSLHKGWDRCCLRGPPDSKCAAGTILQDLEINVEFLSNAL